MIFLIGIIYLAAVAFAMREVSKELQRRDGNKGMLWNGRELSERTMGIGHRPRMKFLTPFSCEETLERLSSMCAPFDCTFTKECADEKDCMYVLDVQVLRFNALQYKIQGISDACAGGECSLAVSVCV